MKSILPLICGALLAFTGASNAQIIYPSDNGFESPNLTLGTLVVAPTDTPWTFSTPFSDAQTSPNESGIATSGSQNLIAAQGQAAFLQDVSSISQTVTLPTASFSVIFDWEGRDPVSYTNSMGQDVTTGQNEITVMLGGILLFSGTPTNTTGFESITTGSIDLSEGSYELTFSGVSSGVPTDTFIDDMSFIDNVQINEAPVPEPSTFGLMILGGMTLLALCRTKTSKAQN